MKKQMREGVRKNISEAVASRRPFINLTAGQRERLVTVAGITLAIVGAAGTVAVAVVAPNLFQALNSIYRATKRKKLTFEQSQEKIAQTFYYLRRHGYIKMVKRGDNFFVNLTEKGHNNLERLSMQNLHVPTPKKWQRTWWLVAADIPTKQYRWAADAFRKKLQQMGFYPLQRTLWIYPYNPIEQMGFLLDHLGIGHFATVMEIKNLDEDDEEKLKEFFKI